MKLEKWTIFIVDDDLEVCAALRCLFESVRFKVETYSSAQLFLNHYTHEMQGCIVVDVRMPVMSGLELLEHLNERRNLLPVIVVTGYAEITMAIRAMKLGAADFVLKPFNDQCLLEVVQKCNNKATHSGIEIHTREIRERINLLSKRERQVMDLILSGKLNKEIAYELSISISTVEVHRANIMRKMQAKTLAQLIKFYLQNPVEAIA